MFLEDLHMYSTGEHLWSRFIAHTRLHWARISAPGSIPLIWCRCQVLVTAVQELFYVVIRAEHTQSLTANEHLFDLFVRQTFGDCIVPRGEGSHLAFIREVDSAVGEAPQATILAALLNSHESVWLISCSGAPYCISMVAKANGRRRCAAPASAGFTGACMFYIARSRDACLTLNTQHNAFDLLLRRSMVEGIFALCTISVMLKGATGSANTCAILDSSREVRDVSIGRCASEAAACRYGYHVYAY
jgi:hypothetical protein